MENIKKVVELLQKKAPGSFSNVQSLSVKLAESVALPIYNVLPVADKEEE